MLLRLLVGVLAGPVWSASARGIGGCEVLDLTHALDRNNPYHPVFRPFDLQYKQRGPYKNLPYVEWNFYCTYEHLGTHIDAPLHFSKGGQSVDQIPLSNLIKEACVIDVRDKVSSDLEYELTQEDIEAWESENGEMDAGCMTLLLTGRSKDWNNMAEYFATNNVGNAATFKHPGVAAVGIDSISLDSSKNQDQAAHYALLKDAAMSGLENMAQLEKLPARGATIVAAPTKIRGGTGGQTRVFAIGWQDGDPCGMAKIGSISAGRRSQFSLSLLLLLPLLLLFRLS